MSTTISSPPRAEHVQIRGIVATLLPQHPSLPHQDVEVVADDVTRHVAAQLEQLPPHLALGYRLGLTAFRAAPLLRYARTWAALTPHERRSFLTSWEALPVAPTRDLIKLLRSLVLFAYYDHPVVRRALGCPVAND